MTTIEYAELDSPIGRLGVAAHAGRLCLVKTTERWPGWDDHLARRFGTVELVAADDPAGAASALDRYFAGDLAALDDLPVDPGGTPFRRRVWEALRRIEPGTTRSYAEVAAAVRAPRAVRAVGSANGANPVGIVVPCHRVVRSDGSLGGYAGGLERKRWLLDHEAALAAGAAAGGQ